MKKKLKIMDRLFNFYIMDNIFHSIYIAHYWIELNLADWFFRGWDIIVCKMPDTKCKNYNIYGLHEQIYS